MLKSLLPLLLAALCLSACEMIVPPWKWSALRKEAHQPMTCVAGQDCADKWQRALQWVKLNSSRPITTQSRAAIITDDSLLGSPESGFKVTFTPTDDGDNILIHFEAACNDPFGCMPPILKLRASFAHYVMTPDAPLKKVQ